MKKKSCIVLISIISVLCLAFSLSACAGKVEFKVSFVVDGQTVHTINTNGNEVIAMPPDPQKADYIFDGWYWDKDVWEKPFTANSLLDAPLSSNMNVYCKWRPEHEHAFTQEVVEDKYKTSGASCTEKSKYYYSCVCGETGVETFEYGELLQHTEETITGKVATCKETGLTDGKKCSVCGKVLVEQSTIPVSEHIEETITGKSASCTEDGLTDGKKCSVCQTILVEQETIPAAHIASAWIKDRNSTCSEKGGRHKECVVCGSTLSTEEIALAPHTETTIYGKLPTCTDSGLTNGRICSVCGTTTAEQTVIPATGHKYDGGVCLSCGIEQSPATISDVKGGTINDLDIYMFVEHDVTEVNLLRIVTCSPKSTWKLYEDKRGQREIATKIASGENDELNNGNNVFYIVATSANGIDVNTYMLTIYRSYAVTVKYYNGSVLERTDNVYTGHEYTAEYAPEYRGYTFNGWKNGREAFTNAVLWDNLVLNADKTAQTFMVSFVTDSKAQKIESFTATYDQAVTLPASSKTGYTFNGWLDGNEISENTFVWNFIEDKEYTAKFTANEYTITYVPNGGTLASTTQKVTYHSEYTLYNISRLGYTFEGYTNKSEEFTSGVYTIADDITINAQWEIIIYTITYNLDDRTINAKTNPTIYTVEDNITFANGTKTGYTFNGWYSEDSYANAVTKIDKGTVGDKVLYAKTTANEYTITYIPNGGTLASTTQTVTYDQEVTLPASGKTGYTFNGWLDGNEISENTFVWNFIEDKQYTAKFTANEYTITYIPNGGTLTSTTQTVTYGSEYTLYDITRLGYSFEGYTKDGEQFTSGVYTIADDVTINAEWEIINYTITYHLYGSANGVSNPMTYTIYDNIMFTNGTKTGYTFDGWYLEEGYVNAVTGIPKGSIGDIDIFAKITPITYTITYVTNGGTIQTTINAYNIEQSITLNNPQKDHYDFIGWYNNVDFDGQPISEIETGNYGDKTFYAKWMLHAYSITYNLNGGTIETEINSYDIEHSVTFDNPTKTDYTFMGWYLDEEFSIQVTGIEVGNYGNRAFYAKWQYGTEGLQYTLNNGKYTVSGYIGNVSGVTIPSTWNGYPVTIIYASAFKDCSGVTSVTIPDSVTGIGSSAFSGCSGLTSIIVDSDNPNYCSQDGILYDKNKTNFVCIPQDIRGDVTIPNSIKSIDDNAFLDRIKLTSIKMSSSVTSIGGYAFSGCSSLKSITISENVTSIGARAFYHCSSLTSVTIPSKVTRIEQCTFAGCSSLTSVTISSNVTSIGWAAFMDCIKLSSITIPSKVEIISSGAFERCSSLTSVTFAANKDWIVPYHRLSASSLSNPATAAEYLTSTYCDVDWQREDAQI